MTHHEVFEAVCKRYGFEFTYSALGHATVEGFAHVSPKFLYELLRVATVQGLDQEAYEPINASIMRYVTQGPANIMIQFAYKR